MGGVIGGKWGDATVYMENVVSAPVMDVYNDVVSAYQWYAFRGCGMLIGHTEEPYSDGRTSGIATAKFLTCENVKVYYGDWVNYTYYQFANQTDKDGNRLWYSDYPWVRAEVGEYCDAFSNIRYGIPLINGVKVTELSEADFNKAVTSSTKIVFDQLYGADRGMYGNNKHDGVEVFKTNTKTIYFQNNWKWDNVYLYYWYEHVSVVDGKEVIDSWNNDAFPGVKMEKVANDGTYDIYRIEVPTYASGFVFNNGIDVNDVNHKQSVDIDLASANSGDIYFMHYNGTTDKNEVYSCKYNSDTKTVNFKNSWKWTNIKIYYWYTDGKNDWPQLEWDDRQTMTKNGTTYSFDLPAFADGYVITGEYNGTVMKTSDQSVSSLTSGKTHYVQEFGINPSANTYTIFFQNNWKWTDVRIYTWDSKGNNGWPGASMVKVGNDGTYDIYCYEVSTSADFIINGIKDDGSGSRDQSPNITTGIKDGICYYMFWSNGNQIKTDKTYK